jgi:hypothetical protein
MSTEKPKAAWAGELTEEQAKATIAHLQSVIAGLERNHAEKMAAERKAHNDDAHRRNEHYAALQQQLMTTQERVCALQNKLLEIRRVASEPL